jgi:hypothetical protein
MVRQLSVFMMSFLRFCVISMRTIIVSSTTPLGDVAGVSGAASWTTASIATD